jgi:trigger factor
VSTCKRVVEVSIPVEEVEKETGHAVAELSQRVRLPGFRPGKVPQSIIRSRFDSEIRQKVIEALVPRAFQKRAEDENLRIVGTPDITEVHFHPGEPLRFKAEFEVAPEIELKEYVGLTVPYSDPEVTEEDIGRRLEELRDQKADYINVDPRPVEDGDYAVVLLERLDGPAGKADEVMLHVGGEDTLPAFSENVRGMGPGEEKEFDVPYPAEYGDENLAGKTIRFKLHLKGIRKKELPELNDEFARDLGDFQGLEELRMEVRKSILREKEHLAQQAAKNKLVEALVAGHDFPVPETFIDRQIEIQLGQFFAARGVDPQTVRVDWDKLKESQRPRAAFEVKASLVLDRIGDREAIEATVDEVDREVQRIARAEKENVVAVRRRLEKEGVLRRIASRIRTEKVLNFLFERARKVAED